MSNAKLGTSYDDKFTQMELGKLRATVKEQQAEIEWLRSLIDPDYYAVHLMLADAKAEIEMLRDDLAISEENFKTQMEVHYKDRDHIAKLQAVVDAAKEFKEWWHEDMRGSVSYDKLCAALAALKEATE